MSKINFSEGNISKALITLAIPITLANILQTAYQIIDMYWVGQLGKKAIAAVSASSPILFFILALASGLTIAGAILVSQARGRNDEKAVGHITTQTMLAIGIVALILSLIGYILSPFILKIMGINQEIFSLANNYLRLLFVGTFFILIFMAAQSIMRGVGRVKEPMFIVGLTVLLNFFLDPFFIYGLGPLHPMGVNGAALATIITQAIAAIAGIGILLVRSGIEIDKNVSIKKNTLIALAKLGAPASIEQSTRAFGLALLTALAAYFGTTALAAYGIGTRLLSLIIIPALGISVATSTIVGHNFGAKKKERVLEAVKLSGKISFTILTLAGILLFIFATQIVTIFAPNNPDVIKLGAEFVRLMSLTFGFIGVQMTGNGVFRGIGKTTISMISSLSVFFLVRLPLAYILSKLYGIEGFWWAFPLSNIVGAGIAIYLFIKIWKKLKFPSSINA